MARRKPRVVWLPVDRLNRVGVAPGATNSSTTSSIAIQELLALGPLGNTVTEVIPVVLDKTPELGLTAGVQSLADVTQSSYRLRRIVGKIHASIGQRADLTGPTQPTSCLLTVGFIVLRINEEDSAPLQNAAQYDATSYGNISDPWIWRRTWLLTNLTGQALTALAEPDHNVQGLASTSQGGSLADGPHVDAKTARVIGPEERLFMVSTTTAVATTSDGQVGALVTILADLRVLASMKSSQGNRRNASR